MIQTNRVLLIEEIAPNKENIVSTVNYIEQREGLSDEEINEIHKKLEVSSFDEVIEKFNPCIYMLLDTDHLQVEFFKTFSAEMPIDVQVIPIANQMPFFDELVELIENKRKHRYVLTSFQDFGDSLIDVPNVTGLTELREAIFYEITNGNSAKAEKLLDELIKKYDNGVLLIRTFLNEAEVFFRQSEEGRNSCFIVQETENTQIHVVNASERFEHNRSHTKEQEDAYIAFLNEILPKKQINNRRLMALILELICKSGKYDLGIFARNYEEYQEFYGKILQNFWWEAKPVLETLLGIKSFFDSYTTDDGIMPPTIVVTNCTPEMLADHKYKDVFRVYLETMNEKNYHDKTIWYAILPRMPFKSGLKEQIRERFAAKGTRYTYQANDLEYVQVVLELLEQYHIQTFLSIIPGKDTVFHALVRNGLEAFEDSFLFLEKEERKEFLIPCYPNFTIIPQEYAALSLGKQISYDALYDKVEFGKEKMLWMSEVIVEASYVAAGLQAACQCPQYLSQFYKKHVRQDVSGVAYRICEKDHNLCTTSQMFPEVMGYSEELTTKLNRYSKGIVFAPYKGKVIAMTDRVYSYKQDMPDYIANIQTLTYMERIIRYESQDYKDHLIKEFFQARPGSIISRWKDSAEAVNAILKKEEQIEYSINEKENSCTFKVQFKERSREDVVKISR